MEQKNLISQSSDWRTTNNLLTDEKQIFEAHRTKKISAANDRELKQVLGVVGIMVGLQTPPNEVEEIILLDALRNVYPAIGIQELQLAFIMGSAGKLSVNMEHYGVLSFRYISEVLQAYIKVAKEVVNKIETAYVPPELPKPKPQTDDEFIEENYALWFAMKNKFYQFINHNVYEKLIKKGLMNLSEEDKIRIRAIVKFDIEKSTEKRKFSELKDRLTQIKDAPDGLYFERQCKKFAVAEFFNNIFNEGKLRVL